MSPSIRNGSDRQSDRIHRGLPAVHGAPEDHPLLGGGADADPVGQRFGGGAAEAEDEAGPEPPGIEGGQVEAGDVEVDYTLACQQLGQGFPSPKGVEHFGGPVGHDDDRLGHRQLGPGP